MKVFLINERKDINATGEFDKRTRELKVLKNSKVSKDISYSAKFRGSKGIEKQRTGKIVDCILQEDVLFKSPSTAGNFVTGRSTNGLTAWKDKDGKTIKEILGE